MTRKWIWILISALVVLVLAGCYSVTITPAAAPGTPSMLSTMTPTWAAAPGGATALPTTVPTSQATPPARGQIITTGTPTSLPMNPATLAIVNLVKQNLSRRTGIPVDQIELVDVQSATWPDQSLGCPEPGPAHAQVQVKGTKIRLSAGGRVYEYHFGGNVGPVLCPIGGTPAK
jgi:hypothetical protein